MESRKCQGTLGIPSASKHFFSFFNHGKNHQGIDASCYPRASCRVPAAHVTIYPLTAGTFGVGGSWVLLFLVRTPSFETPLPAGNVQIHFVFPVSPLFRLTVATLVGVPSVKCTNRYGRRRPSTVGGLIAEIGMLVFPNATQTVGILVEVESDVLYLGSTQDAVDAFSFLGMASNFTILVAPARTGASIPGIPKDMVQRAPIVHGFLGESPSNGLVHSPGDPVALLQPLGLLWFVVLAGMLLLLRNNTLLRALRSPSPPTLSRRQSPPVFA